MDPVSFGRTLSPGSSQPLSHTVVDPCMTFTDRFPQSTRSIQAGGELARAIGAPLKWHQAP
jgi:hypothetical protein